MATNYDFRILIETVSGSQLSYGTGSFVSLDNTSVVMTTSESQRRIHNMPKINYFNSKTNTTSSALFNNSSSLNNGNFLNTEHDGIHHYQFVSSSIRDSQDSGSIIFHANTNRDSVGDIVKRYKFFGNKVCTVMGIPENYWIYADSFRLTNTGSEQNYLSGDVLAQSVNIKTNFAISNAGSIETDLPFRHSKDTDRWLKWVNISGSLPKNEMMIGYSNLSDKYMIRMQNNEDLIISSSNITASGNILANGNIIGDDATNISGINHITASGNISASGDLLLLGDIHQHTGSRAHFGTSSFGTIKGLAGDTSEECIVSIHSNDSNQLMIMNNDHSIGDGQYFGGIGFHHSDGVNSNTHPTGANAAIMVRAGEIQTTTSQGVGMEFRIKLLNTKQTPEESFIAYRINPFDHGTIESDDIYGASGDDEINATHEFSGSAIFKDLANIGPSQNNNAFLTQSQWRVSPAGGGRAAFYWNKSDGQGEVDLFVQRGAAAAANDNNGGLDIYDIDPGHDTQKLLSVKRHSVSVSSGSGFFGHQPWHKTAFHGADGQNTGECFVDWTGKDTSASGTTTDPVQGLVMPFDGYIKRVVYRVKQDTGATDFSFYKVSNGTSLEDLDGSPLGDTKSVTISSNNTAGIADFDSGPNGNYTFSAGDLIALSIDPTNDANYGAVTVTFMCNVTY